MKRIRFQHGQAKAALYDLHLLHLRAGVFGVRPINSKAKLLAKFIAAISLLYVIHPRLPRLMRINDFFWIPYFGRRLTYENISAYITLLDRR